MWPIYGKCESLKTLPSHWYCPNRKLIYAIQYAIKPTKLSLELFSKVFVLICNKSQKILSSYKWIEKNQIKIKYFFFFANFRSWLLLLIKHCYFSSISFRIYWKPFHVFFLKSVCELITLSLSNSECHKIFFVVLS